MGPTEGELNLRHTAFNTPKRPTTNALDYSGNCASKFLNFTEKNS